MRMLGTGRFELPHARRRLGPLAGLIGKFALQIWVGVLRGSAVANGTAGAKGIVEEEI